MSIEGLGLKKRKVSPTRGKPMDPGGSLPVLHGGFIHLYVHEPTCYSNVKGAAQGCVRVVALLHLHVEDR
jgi:hypothetical protein